VTRVLVDRIDESGVSVARLPWQADDIDGVTLLDERIEPGEFADVTIEEVVDDYDFRARVIQRVERTAPPGVQRIKRTLPMAATIGSYGR
jgi:hypothetical protein